VRVRVRKTTGSGLRENLYAHSAGFGTGSRLTFVDTLAAFIHNNERSILPLRPSLPVKSPLRSLASGSGCGPLVSRRYPHRAVHVPA
jgi:hypothetical protein